MNVKPLPASLRAKLLSNERPFLLAPDEVQPLLDFIHASPADARRMLMVDQDPVQLFAEQLEQTARNLENLADALIEQALPAGASRDATDWDTLQALTGLQFKPQEK
jgi:hypothetical protein